MADQEVHHDRSEYELTPTARRWWPKIVAICASLGAIYGAALGSALNTTAGAAEVIGAAAGIVAVLCGIPGARLGFFLGMLSLRERTESELLKRVRFGRLFVGTVAALGGAILGGYLGLMALAPLGAVILGAVAGWFFMRAILWRFFLRRILGGVVGLMLGAGLGATIAALEKDQAAALIGIAWGAGVGTVVGPLLFLAFIGTLCALPHTQDGERGNVVDATFRESD